MKKTRNLLVLTGSGQDVQLVMDNIQFKGVTVLTPTNLTKEKIAEVLANNKSAVCNEFEPCEIPKNCQSVKLRHW